MLLAFTSSMLPGVDVGGVARAAASLGYGGVEAFLPSAAEADPTAGSILTDLESATAALGEAKVSLVGLATTLRFSTDLLADQSSPVKRVIELARELDCPRIRMLDAAAPANIAPGDLAQRLADWLLPLADFASTAGVSLLVQNALAFRTAGPLWAMLERADHPALGIAWDALSAALAGETPGVSVPTLNSRIQLAILRDAKINAEPSHRPALAGFKPVGQGDAHLPRLVTRLRGVGFVGPAVVDYPQAALSALDGGEAVLKQAAAQWQAWKPAAPKPAAKKPAAK
jgi:sugar phosphate isomerase/epimerase